MGFPRVIRQPSLLQALFRQSLAKSTVVVKAQLYVDDPAVCARGPADQVDQAFDLLLGWWLALGFPLAWRKGSVHRQGCSYDWIGVRFTPVEDGTVLMELPEAFLRDFLLLLRPFCRSKGACSLRDAERLVGRAGRIAYIVPGARPFVGGLYAALAASKKDLKSGKTRLDANVVACRRFATAACWLRALIKDGAGAIFPNRRVVRPGGPLAPAPSDWVAQFDASTTGGGAVLRLRQRIVAYTYVAWQPDDASALGVAPGDSAFQSFWEMAMILVCLELWGDDFKHESLAVVGDNTGALQNALDLQGSGVMAAVAREISWRRERRMWSYVVGHIPSERNTVPDALSRQHEVPPIEFPHHALRHAHFRKPPVLGELWCALAFPR